MSSYYHCFDGFIGTPKDGQTLREFIEWDCGARATQIQKKIENLSDDKEYLAHPDYELVAAMPVNFCTFISNWSVKKHGFDAPPLVADRMGGKVYVDDDYSFFGTFGDFLIHISAPCYGWIGELEYPNWEICKPDLIIYNNYDYDGGDLDDDEEEEE